MSLDNAAQTYKNTENIYAKGIETPHGRIKIVFDVIEKNLETPGVMDLIISPGIYIPLITFAFLVIIMILLRKKIYK